MLEFGPTALLTELLCFLVSYVLHVSKEEAAYGSIVMFHLHCVRSRAVEYCEKDTGRRSYCIYSKNQFKEQSHLLMDLGYFRALEKHEFTNSLCSTGSATDTYLLPGS